MYLIRVGNGMTYHLFENNDTKCKLYSTGGMVKSKFKPSKTISPNHKLCKSCQRITASPSPT